MAFSGKLQLPTDKKPVPSSYHLSTRVPLTANEKEYYFSLHINSLSHIGLLTFKCASHNQLLTTIET